jgi:hypothetical protein
MTASQRMQVFLGTKFAQVQTQDQPRSQTFGRSQMIYTKNGGLVRM